MLNVLFDFDSPCPHREQQTGVCGGVWMRADMVCSRCVCVCVFMACSYLEFICIVEADLHRWDHPGLKQRAEDSIGYRVCDEVKVKRISPES